MLPLASAAPAEASPISHGVISVLCLKLCEFNVSHPRLIYEGKIYHSQQLQQSSTQRRTLHIQRRRICSVPLHRRHRPPPRLPLQTRTRIAHSTDRVGCSTRASPRASLERRQRRVEGGGYLTERQVRLLYNLSTGESYRPEDHDRYEREIPQDNNKILGFIAL